MARNVVQEWTKAIRDCPEVTGTELLVGLTLSTYATYATGQDVRPRLRNVAEAIGMKPETLSRHVRSLVGGGWLTLVAVRFGNHREFRLSFPTPDQRLDLLNPDPDEEAPY